MVCAPPAPMLCRPQDFPPPLPWNEGRQRRISPAERPIALVIDDEHIIADTIAQILNMRGFAAVPLYSGQAAVEQAWTQCPAIVITDVVMPGLDGIETAKRLLKHCPSTKILLLSGQAATVEMMRQARADGFNFELLAKPVHPEDLLSVLRRLGF